MKHRTDEDLARLELAKSRLAVARGALLERSDEELLESLCRVLELWRDPNSRWRRRLLAEHPDRAGFSSQIVRLGLELGLQHWSGQALREMLERELAPQLAGGGRAVSPFPLTSVLLAGSIPMPSLLQCLLPLVLRSPILVRSASRDPVTARLLAGSIAEVDAELGRCIEIVSFRSDNRRCLSSFLAADCVVASGCDDTIGEVSRAIGAGQRFVGYGHKLSVAVVGQGATRGQGLAELVSGLSLDIALWDQLGCLSPLAVFVIDDDASTAVARVGEALCAELALRQRELPRGDIDAASAAAISHERSEAEMRSASGRRVSLHCSERTLFSVICEDDAVWRPAPLHRFVRVHPLANGGELIAALQPLARQLAGVALAGFGDSRSASDSSAVLTQGLVRLGASRVCRPGRLQAPPLAWRRDGLPVVLPLARFSDLEAR